MKRKHQQILVGHLLSQVGNLVEFYSEMMDDLAKEGVTAEEVAVQLGKWLSHLPGDSWDTRLVFPGKKEE
jgi:hypothetical protein